MERIRRYNNRWQVLITPGYPFDAGYALLLGNWTDPNLRGYSIEEVGTFEDALDIAFKYPQLDWYKIILFQKDIFVKLRIIISKILEKANIIVEFEPHLMTPEELKNTMFDRVMVFGERFRLRYNLNDTIGYHIINPFSNNLKELFVILRSIPDLRIIDHTEEHGVIRLIGQTDLSTTYEIVLWPTLLANWAKWNNKNPHIPEKSKEEYLQQIIKAQNQIDTTVNTNKYK